MVLCFLLMYKYLTKIKFKMSKKKAFALRINQDLLRAIEK